VEFLSLFSVIVIVFDIPYERCKYNGLLYMRVSERIGAEKDTLFLLV